MNISQKLAAALREAITFIDNVPTDEQLDARLRVGFTARERIRSWRDALAAYDAEEAEQAKLRDDHELTIEAARSNYASDDIQIDDQPALSVVKGGVWVAGWLFIPIESEEVQP